LGSRVEANNPISEPYVQAKASARQRLEGEAQIWGHLPPCETPRVVQQECDQGTLGFDEGFGGGGYQGLESGIASHSFPTSFNYPPEWQSNTGHVLFPGQHHVGNATTCAQLQHSPPQFPPQTSQRLLVDGCHNSLFIEDVQISSNPSVLGNPLDNLAINCLWPTSATPNQTITLDPQDSFSGVNSSFDIPFLYGTCLENVDDNIFGFPDSELSTWGNLEPVDLLVPIGPGTPPLPTLSTTDTASGACSTMATTPDDSQGTGSQPVNSTEMRPAGPFVCDKCGRVCKNRTKLRLVYSIIRE
jgi:hypothetical protein